MFGNLLKTMPRQSPFLGMGQQKPAMPAPQAAQPQRYTNQRNTAQRIAGILADALAGAAGQQGPYAAQIASERARFDQEATYQRRRADDFADWQRQKEWERAHPAPVNNDTVADYNFIRQNLGDDAAAEFLKNKANPPVYRQGPDGQFYRVEPAQPQSLGTELPPGWTVQGGSGGNAAGNFR